MTRTSLASWTWLHFVNDVLHRLKAVMAGENLSPLWARRWQDHGDTTLQRWLPPTQGENALHMHVGTSMLSLLLLWHSHCMHTTYRSMLSIMHTRCVHSLLAIFPPQLRKKGSSLWQTLLPNSSCRAVAPGVQLWESIPEMSRSKLLEGRREAMQRQSDSCSQKGSPVWMQGSSRG